MTKAMSRVGYLLGVAVFLSGFALPPQVQSHTLAPKGQQQTNSQPTVGEPATTDAFTETLVADLSASGFQVSQGCPMLYPLDACINYTYPLLGSCFGNNPAAPYVMPVMKSWPDEYVDPATVNAWGATLSGYSATYRLDQREAIVMYGQMPPPGKYKGLQTLLFTAHGQWKPKDYNLWAQTPDLPFPIQFLFGTIPPRRPEVEAGTKHFGSRGHRQQRGHGTRVGLPFRGDPVFHHHAQCHDG